MLRRTLLLGAALMAAAAATSAFSAEARAQSVQPHWAQPQRDRPERRDARVLSVREVVERVRRQRGGRFVGVRSFERGANPPFYVLVWEDARGNVDDIRVNALTGRIMG